MSLASSSSRRPIGSLVMVAKNLRVDSRACQSNVLLKLSTPRATSRRCCHVITSPHPDVDVSSVESTTLPHFILNEFHKYDKKIAMVSI